MKAKLMALLLAAGLGVTGVAMTVNECAHSNKNYIRTDVVKAMNMNDGRHYVTYRTVYFCKDCDSHVEKWESKYELHDYEQIYYADGTVLSYCIVCDEKYYW